MIINRRAAMKGSIEQVFGLTGGELEENGWNGFAYWYEGTPEYAESEFDRTGTYRTAICQLPWTQPDKEVVCDGKWKQVGAYSSSGETECPFMGHAVKPEECAPHEEGLRDRCPFCDEPVGEKHAYVYIGDGWHEIVYQLIEGEDD